MRRFVLVFFSAALAFSCLPASAQEQAAPKTLHLSTDLDCNWKLDGQPMGLLKSDTPKVVPVSSGEHLVQAATTDGLVKVRAKVEVDQGQSTVALQLKSLHDQKLKIQQAEAARKKAEAEAALHPTWTDPDTGLMWTKKDNGSNVNWKQASDYCAKLQLAGYKDWRLPAIEELKGIYDPDASVQADYYESFPIIDVHIKGKLQLTGFQWSSSLEDVSWSSQPVPWHFNFASESGETLDGWTQTWNWSMRALCVRPSGENIPDQTTPDLPKGGDEISPG